MNYSALLSRIKSFFSVRLCFATTAALGAGPRPVPSRNPNPDPLSAKDSKFLGIEANNLPSELGNGIVDNSMCAYVAPQDPSSPPGAPTGKSLLSRLTSPLRPRTRNLADFYIEPAEPHRRYSPGDVVKGIVVLTVIKPIRVTHLTVALHGFVRVYKNPNGASEAGVEVPATGSSRKTKYLGNGYASLFQDEIILCGEGRLDVGVYEFEFNLEFPGKGLPSSLDFERGTISYMLRSTITRPTSISATASCEQKVSLVETVDVGPLRPPEPRVISLEPISKKPKKQGKSKTRSEQSSSEATRSQDVPRSGESPVPEDSAGRRGSAEQVPSSPRSATNFDIQSQSEHSSDNSQASNSTGVSFNLSQAPPSKKAASKGKAGSSRTPPTEGTITATVELLKAGCLPGDSIPLKITIQHTKWIKSLHGIIITLYRQGRIDSAPPLSLFTDIKGKAAEKLKHEEYYPKSKTGLGGLSLSSAGSSSVFRKDLSQTLAPIIIDPNTLSTVVTASVRVPENAFPTITGVPGEMISFKYYIEVVVDLGGKLAGQDRHLPRLGMISLPSITNNGNQMGRDVGSSEMLAAWGGNIVNTDHIRREKSVVACLFDMVVGTTDSARLRGRGNVKSMQIMEDIPGTPRSHSSNREQPKPQESQPQSPTEPQYPYHNDHPDAEQLYYEDDGNYGYHGEHNNQNVMNQNPNYHYGYVPPPELPPEETMNEKERVRLAEQRLLPSQPPRDDGPSSGNLLPSAPHPLDGHYDLLSTASPSAPTLPTIAAHPSLPSAPPLADLPDTSSTPSQPPIEDKQELERRRLMAEASSPADFPNEEDDDNGGEGSSSRRAAPLARDLAATAPVIPEESEELDERYGDHGFHPHADGQRMEMLPRYER